MIQQEQKDNTCEFMKEYSLLLALNKAAEDVDETNGLPRTSPEEDAKMRAAAAKFVTPFDTDVKPCEIRLLSQPDKLTYAAVLPWSGKHVLLVPFSHLSHPATDQEMYAEGNESKPGFQQVYQVWNARTANHELVSRSWTVGTISEADVLRLNRMLRYCLLHEPLDPEVRRLTGTPLSEDDDIRKKYMRNELDHFVGFDREDVLLDQKSGLSDLASNGHDVSTPMVLQTDPGKDEGLKKEERGDTDFFEARNIKYSPPPSEKNENKSPAGKIPYSKIIFSLAALFVLGIGLVYNISLGIQTYEGASTGPHHVGLVGWFYSLFSGSVDEPSPAPGPEYVRLSEVPVDPGNAVSFLTNMSGGISFLRNGSKCISSGECEILYENDLVALEAGSSASIYYDDKIFEVVGPASFVIWEDAPFRYGDDNLVTKSSELSYAITGLAIPTPVAMTPVVSSETDSPSGGSGAGKKLLQSPLTLLASIAPITVRAGDGYIPVYSPRGFTFSAHPEIMIGGNRNDRYVVEIFDAETDKQVGRTITVNGGEAVPWTELSDKPMADGEQYTITVTGKDDKSIENDPTNNMFEFSSDKHDKIVKSKTFQHINAIKDETVKSFFMANMLYTEGFYSDSYCILSRIANGGNMQKSIENLKKLCLNKLKIRFDDTSANTSAQPR